MNQSNANSSPREKTISSATIHQLVTRPKPYFFLWAFLFFPLCIFAHTELQVRALKNQIPAVPGQTVSVPIQITNITSKEYTFQSELELPPGWKILTTHQLINTIPPMQTRIYTLMVMVPHEQITNRYPIFYKTWNISHPERLTVSEALICVEGSDNLMSSCRIEPESNPNPPSMPNFEEVVSIFKESENDPTFQVIPPPSCMINCGEIFYFSVRVENPGITSLKETLRLLLPPEWNALPGQTVALDLPPQETAVKVFGVKSAKKAESRSFPITVQLIGETKREKTFFVNMLPLKGFSACLDNPNLLQVAGMHKTLVYTCSNEGNQPLNIRWEARGDPICRISFDSSPITIPPYQSKKFEMRIYPTEEDLQFVYVKIYQENGDQLLYQDTLRLEVNSKEVLEDDLFLRIPTTLTSYFLGECSKRRMAFEWAGEGFIDPESSRYLEFYFCSPTGDVGSIYNLEETYYLRLKDPFWTATLGDAVYALSPLTLGYRYGTGLELIYQNGKWAYGSNYVQSPICEEKQLRQMGTFISYFPTPTEEFSINYLFQGESERCRSHLLSLETGFLLDSGGVMGAEFGQNLKGKGKANKKAAYRVYLRDCFRNRTWCDFETLYAGPDFPGYYENCRYTSFGINTPLAKHLQFSLSYNMSKQNDYPKFHHQRKQSRSEQTQWNSAFNYDFGNGMGASLNGLYLQAREQGGCEASNFKQRWIGPSFWVGKNDYWWIATASLGEQKDFLKKKTERPLYRYYFLAGKDLSPNLFVSLSYDGGSVDYYDADQWKNVFTGSFRYRYDRGCFVELLLQHTRERCKNFALSQGILNFLHSFPNHHELAGSMRYLVEKRRSKEYSFLLSYTVPLSTPVGKRKDIGSLTGEVYNVYDNCLVSQAAISLSGNRAQTEGNGRFHYFGVPVGEQLIKAETLPFPLIALEAQAQKIDIRGGENLKIRIPVIPSCSLKGTVLLFDQKEPFIVEDVIEKGGFEGARMFIERMDGKEIYTCLTDSKGAFQFLQLRPGKWKVTIRVNPLPLLHFIENETFELDIKPLEEKEITIKILPKVRQIKPLKPVIVCKSRFLIDSKYAGAYLHDEAKLGSLASWVN